MNWNLRVICAGLALTVSAPLGLGCAQWQLPAARELEPRQLEARGPGTLFASIEAAAADALIHAYLSAKDARNVERTRGGSIYATRGGYSYDEIVVAGRVAPQRVRYRIKPGDVARFVTYPRHSDRRLNRKNERPSHLDRRGVTFKDPLQRPLYILHPSLVIREYRGEGQELTDVADLRHRTRAECMLADFLSQLSDNSC